MLEDRRCLLVLLLLTCSLAGFSCVATNTVHAYESVPSGARVAVIAFRDCMIPGQEDCGGSGNIAGNIYAQILATRPGTQVVPLSRPVGAAESLTDDAATKYASSKGFEYVVNGEVNDFYRVAPMTFRSERVGLAVRLIRVTDGKVIAFQSEAATAGNLTTPERMLERIASKLRDKF